MMHFLPRCSPALRSGIQLAHTSRPPIQRRLFGTSYAAAVASGKILIWSCIGINAAVFGLWQLASKPQGGMARMQRGPSTLARWMETNFICSPAHIRARRYWTVITSAFSHINTGHLLGNMFTLHAFGTTMLYLTGLSPWHIGTIMLGSALCGSLGHLYQARSSGRQVGALGASGMTMGLGAAAAMLVPYANMLLFGVVPVPMWALFLGYTAIDTFFLNDPLARTGHAAHLGGAAFGLVYYILFLRRMGGILGGFP